MFRELSAQQKSALAGIAVPCRFGRGEVVFHQGAASVGFYLILSGSVNVHRVGMDGKERLIRIFQAGESFAEASLLAGGVYPASARAMLECRLFLLPKAAFLALLERDASFGLRMFVSMSLRLHEMISAIEGLRVENMRERLLRWLISRCPRTGNPISYTISLPTTKATLAAELGMQPETLSRHLTSLRESGDLAINRREIVVLNFEHMRKLVSEMEA
jgi:CRP-like cAMP-binding protein